MPGGIFASTGWPRPTIADLSVSSLPLAKKLALISDGDDLFAQSPASESSDGSLRRGLKADKVGKAEILSQMKLSNSQKDPSRKPPQKPIQCRQLQPKQRKAFPSAGPGRPGGPGGARKPVVCSSASTSASQMASDIRRQLLQLCSQAGVAPPPLQCEVEPVKVTESQKPAQPRQMNSLFKDVRQKRPDVATQLRRATMARAQVFRELQRRSRSVQTAQMGTVPEMCIKMGPEPLIPKSVQLDGYYWQPAKSSVRLEPEAPREPDFPKNLVPNGQIFNTFEDEIVVLQHSGDAFDMSGESSGMSRQDRQKQQAPASLAVFDGPTPHEMRKSFNLEEHQEASPEAPISEIPEGFVSHSCLHSQDKYPSSSLRQWKTGTNKGLIQSAEGVDRTAAADSYDLTVFQALCRKMGQDPDFQYPQPQPQEVESLEESEDKEDATWRGPQKMLESLATPESRKTFSQSYGGVPLEPAGSYDGNQELVPAAAASPSDQCPSRSSASNIQDSLELWGEERPLPSDCDDFLAAATPVEPSWDASESDREISQELPPLPPYRPLPCLPDVSEDVGALKGPSRLAPKQLEEQFYSSLQILDSVQEHLAQVDQLSQQRVLHRQHTSQYDACR